MKLKFNPNLDFQNEAIESITRIFEGQETYESQFTVNKPTKEGELKFSESDIGFGNRLTLTQGEIYNNVVAIQRKNQLPVSDVSEVQEMRFCVEMETGTGKTYVYLKSIMELHQKNGFNKFIIIVPSVSIREGVLKSLEITKDHFRSLYNNIPYNYFVYDSSKPNDILNFAKSQNLEIMVINIQAFNSEDRLINQENDKTSIKPIDLIAQTNPVIIVDEPQSTSSTDKAKEAIKKFNPLAQFDYSATHLKSELINLMFKLGPAEAYNRKLVKQIEVASITPEGFYNHPYVKLEGFSGRKNVKARLELHVKNSKGIIQPKVLRVDQGENMELLTNNDVYRDNFIIESFSREKGREYVKFLNGQYVTYEESINNFPGHEIRRLQIRRTIQEHLDKEKKLNKQGLKVLSLFFIDKVENYRVYTDNGSEHGEYARIFEEEYKNLAQSPEYRDLFEDEITDIDRHVSEVHNGYFAKDRKGQWKDTPETERSMNSADAADVFYAIMRDKEGLLSFGNEFANKIRFIFSHSALKEGWDNPNVFQICTLKEAGGSENRRRQEIGRGLRLAVNQKGERVYGHDINLLTVMASESYQNYAAGLQGEMEKSMHTLFGAVSKEDFAVISYLNQDEEIVNVDKKASTELWAHLRDKGYLQNNGKIKVELKKALKDKTVDLPEFYQKPEIKEQVYSLLLKKAGSLEIKNRDDRKEINVRKEVLLSPEFKALWDKIKYKTRFEVDYDVEKLKQEVIRQIKEKVYVFDGVLNYNKGHLNMDDSGIMMVEEERQMYHSQREVSHIPDIVGYLQNQVNLTRKTIVEVLRESGKIDMIKRNPQMFVQSVLSIFKSVMSMFIVDGIKYHRIGEHYYYSQELFEKEELQGFLEKNMTESTKSPYEYVVYDSKIESDLVKDFERSENVKCYAKLPSWFKIETPLGNYNPDWAVVWNNNSEEKVYFVCESKGSLQEELDLKGFERAKIACGKKHFSQTSDVEYEVITNLEDLTGKVFKEQKRNY